MAGKVTNDTRNQLVSLFRERVASTYGATPFMHQRMVWCATDGLELTGEESPEGLSVRLDKDRIIHAATRPRPAGRARFVSDLGAFKIGKSFGVGLWASGFAAVPEGRVSLVGAEYSICEPEFNYICDFLLSEQGMNLKPKVLTNRPRQGDMFLELQNGSRYEAKSWERKDSLKGKEIDCLTGDAPIWMGDFSFKPIKDVKPGDEVIGWGMQRRVRNGVWPKTTRKGLLRTKVLGVHQKEDHVIRLTLESGKTIDCTRTHRWLSSPVNKNFPHPKVGRTLCHVIDQPRELDPSEHFTAGWLAGIYDGEGHRNQICQSLSANPEVFGRIEDNLHKLGFETSRVSGGATGIEWQGGRQAALDFLTFTGSTRFARHADEYILGGRCVDYRDKIVKIEELGIQTVYCLQTETETYIAHGYVSHNCYVFCEAYQLPGIECFTSFSQNLRAREGYAYFPTTPDRPWIDELHQLGHGEDPEWACICDIGGESNPYTFDLKAKIRDQKLMTKEKFEIHYNGKMGKFIGQVFQFNRGDRVFTPESHPNLFVPGSTGRREDLRVPQGWDIVGGADTGTFYSGLLVAFDPEGTAYVLDEFPNYRYVGGEPERDETLSIPQWASQVLRRSLSLGGRSHFWADANSQFKGELRNYGLTLLPAKLPVETRTEITREYFQHNRIWIAPWVTALPFEIENASWPEEASSSGKFSRVKDRDHTLDPLEHILGRRPFGRVMDFMTKKGSWAAGSGYRSKRGARNVHLGRY